MGVRKGLEALRQTFRSAETEPVGFRGDGGRTAEKKHAMTEEVASGSEDQG